MDISADWGQIIALVGAIWGLGSIAGAVVIWAALAASKGPQRRATHSAKRRAMATASRTATLPETARIGAEALHR